MGKNKPKSMQATAKTSWGIMWMGQRIKIELSFWEVDRKCKEQCIEIFVNNSLGSGEKWFYSKEINLLQPVDSQHQQW